VIVVGRPSESYTIKVILNEATTSVAVTMASFHFVPLASRPFVVTVFAEAHKRPIVVTLRR